MAHALQCKWNLRGMNFCIDNPQKATRTQSLSYVNNWTAKAWTFNIFLDACFEFGLFAKPCHSLSWHPPCIGLHGVLHVVETYSFRHSSWLTAFSVDLATKVNVSQVLLDESSLMQWTTSWSTLQGWSSECQSKLHDTVKCFFHRVDIFGQEWCSFI